ncbi:MAG: hypothetical protein LCH53_08450 [Bacteroidetes bacterium]|nr:hypothetical protein [Bacteroidota bacterium]
MSRLHRLFGLLAVLALAVVPLGCAQLSALSNLAQVKFSLVGAQNVSLAGVSLDRVGTYRNIGGADLLRLGTALATGRMPLSMTLLVGAENPSSNPVSTRLVSMDYQVLLDDRQAFQGVVNDPVALSPGQTTRIPISAQTDLMQLVGGNLQQLVDLALAVAGNGAGPRLKVVVQPSIQTPLGAIRYPNPITIVSGNVGDLRN